MPGLLFSGTAGPWFATGGVFPAGSWSYSEKQCQSDPAAEANYKGRRYKVFELRNQLREHILKRLLRGCVLLIHGESSNCRWGEKVQ